MIRPDTYVAVNNKLWAEYKSSSGALRHTLHFRIFYAKAALKLVPWRGQSCPTGCTWRRHPLIGPIPKGYAIRERHYRDETRTRKSGRELAEARRSGRETDLTRANVRGRAL